MWKYITTRVILLFVNLFIIVSAIYFLTTLAMITKWASPAPLSEDIKFAYELYKIFLQNLRNLDFGSRWDGTTYLQLVIDKFPISLKINFMALLIYVPLGVILGVLTAVHKDKLFDKLTATITIVFGSVPTYILVFFLIMFFGYVVPVFPPQYAQGEWYNVYIIPVFTLSLYPLSRVIRIVRGEIIEALESEAVLLLRAKGLTRRQIIFRHLFRESLVALLPQITELFLYVMFMSFIVEKAYYAPGAAKLFLDSIVMNSGDGTAVRVDTTIVTLVGSFYTFMGLVVTLFNDIMQSVIDPRIRLNAKKPDTRH